METSTEVNSRAVENTAQITNPGSTSPISWCKYEKNLNLSWILIAFKNVHTSHGQYHFYVRRQQCIISHLVGFFIIGNNLIFVTTRWPWHQRGFIRSSLQFAWSVRCFKQIWKVGKVGKVGEVGKVGKEGKEDRLRELRLPTLYQILQRSNKKGEKINEQFCCGSLENVDLIERLKFGLLETATNLHIHMSYVRRFKCHVCEFINWIVFS